jgi:hypothetical protein
MEPFVLVGRALVAAAEGRGVVVPDERPEAGVDEALSCFVGDLDGDYIRQEKVSESHREGCIANNVPSKKAAVRRLLERVSG